MSSYTDLNQTKTETAVDKAADAAAQVKDKAGETAAMAKDQAKRAATQVTEQAKATVESRMSDVAQELGNVADVVRQTTHDGGLGTSDTVVRYGERIADQIEGVSSYLDEHGVEEILTDIQDFARRQPAVFLGGAFMLGVVVGRFLRSSGNRMGFDQGGYDRYQSNYDMGSGRYDSGSASGGGSRTSFGQTGSVGSSGYGSAGSPRSASGTTGSSGSDSNLTGSAYSGSPRSGGSTGSTGSNSNTVGATRTGPGNSSATNATKPGYTPSNGEKNSSGSVGSAGQDDYQGRNRYQTGITQESTTTQDES